MEQPLVVPSYFCYMPEEKVILCVKQATVVYEPFVRCLTPLEHTWSLEDSVKRKPKETKEAMEKYRI